MRLETKRIILRLPRQTDISDIVENIHSRDVVRWTSTIPHPYTRNNAVSFIARAAKDKKSGSSYHFMIVLKETGKVIGGVGILKINRVNKSALLGYWVGKKYWGQGFATEASKLALRFAFGELHLHRINGKVYADNHASRRVLEKCGFRQEGISRKARYKYGKWRDLLLFGLLPGELRP